MGAIPWRFKSSPTHKSLNSKRVTLVTLFRFCEPELCFVSSQNKRGRRLENRARRLRGNFVLTKTKLSLTTKAVEPSRGRANFQQKIMRDQVQAERTVGVYNEKRSTYSFLSLSYGYSQTACGGKEEREKSTEGMERHDQAAAHACAAARARP